MTAQQKNQNAVQFLRTFAFNWTFYANIWVFMLGGILLLLAPRHVAVNALKAWARCSLGLLKVMVGIRLEVRGSENIPKNRALIAAKHQSAWDTFGLFPLFQYPTIMMKRELFWIPVHGWFSAKFGLIPVDRKGGAKALRKMIKKAKKAVKQERQIIVFPEGTRTHPGAKPNYKSGIVALYRTLNVPCVPLALNSGVYWPRRKFTMQPGTIVVEALKPIPPGLTAKEFARTLEERLEGASDALLRSL